MENRMTFSDEATAARHLALFRDGRDPLLPANHPVNALSKMRKLAILCTLSYAGFLANFSIAITQCAFGVMGGAFGVSPALIPCVPLPLSAAWLCG